jgi:MoxR-like ATPase
MLFDELGIYGWDVVEPSLLSSVVTDLPVLLIGDIGTNKTEGSKTIAQAVLGTGSAFRHYEVPTLNFDDLVGFLNPKGLAKGTLEFVPTPLSIWKAEAALFDEINRANPFVQSKLHELIRTRQIMGLRPTSSWCLRRSIPLRLIKPGTWTSHSRAGSSQSRSRTSKR